MVRAGVSLATALILSACAVAPIGPRGDFVPRSDYPHPLRTQSYAEPGQRRGGSKLSAVETPKPDYPRRAWKHGVQGWVIVELDVGLDGRTENVAVLREAPAGWFNGVTVSAVEDWRFLPPQSGRLTDCLVRIDFKLGQVMIAG